MNIEQKKKGSKISADEFNEIVETINSNTRTKFGYLAYDGTTQNYLAFADEDAYSEYLDTGDVGLILGNFEAPHNYEAEIKLLSNTYNAILCGDTGNVIRFNFEITNKDGANTGEGIICTYTITNGNSRRSIIQKYRNGQTVEFNVDDYLQEGTNTIRISIQSTDTMAGTNMAVVYQAVNLSLTSDYDLSNVALFNEGDAVVEVPFTVSGTGVKTMEWYLDGEKLPFDVNVDEVLNTTASRSKYITITRDMQEGVHVLQFRASVKINGETFYSPTLHYEIMTYGKSLLGSESAALNWPDDCVMVAQALMLPAGELEHESPNIRMTQYVATKLTFAVFDPLYSAQIPVEIKVNDEVVATIMASNGNVTTYDYIPSQSGEVSLTIRVKDSAVSELPNGGYSEPKIAKTTLGVSEITDNLQFAVDATVKNNDAADKDSWNYNDYVTTFENVKWNSSSGWTDQAFRLYRASMSTNITPLSPNPATRGKTMEFEFCTENVVDDNEVLCNMCGENGAGLIITASEISLISSAGNKLSAKFKNGDNIRVSIVINKPTGTTNKSLALIYINGIISGGMAYARGETFTSTKPMKFSAANSALLIRSMRFYDTALTSDNILNNYILYRKTANEMLSAFTRNDIYETDTNDFSVDKIANTLPVMILTGDVPTIEATTDKKKAIVVDVEYINMQDPTLNFTMKSAQLTGQGTSSMSYPKKNFRLYTQKRDDTVLYNAEGEVVKDRLYSFKKGAIPVKCWCFKADYAESSSTHNTGIARLWNDVMKNAQFTDPELVSKYGEYPLRTKAQQSAIDNDYPYDVRTAIDGFPILMFYRKNEDSKLIFIGKYNFNNDKSTENVFGFKDIPGFDNTNMQCVETLNNGNHLALFKDVENWDKEWKDAFEFRYPDGSENTTALKRLATWLSSTQNNVAKFKEELHDYFDLPKLAAYYIYLLRFGAVDQTVKNSMLATEDGMHWYFINYDNDTILGLRNDGPLVYSPDITRQTIDTSYTSRVYAYAGHDSVLWNNFEACDECMAMAATIDAALYAAGLSVANVTDMFNNKQSAKWCERVYNQDAQYKYIDTFVNDGINNLFMMQGARSSHRAWWLARRFSMIDSKFATGDYRANSFEIKVAGAPIGISFSIRSGYDRWYGYGVNNVIAESGVKLAVGASHSFATKQVLNVGDPLRIYMAPNLTEIDIHNFAPYLSTVNMDKVWSDNDGTRLTKLTLGGSTATEVVNASLSDISGLNSAVFLEELNINGFKEITSLDLSGMQYFKILHAKGSGLQYLLLADGAPVELLELPSGMQSLSLKGLTISPDSVVFEDVGKSLSNINISNCPNMKTDSSFIFNWLSNKTVADEACTVDIEIEWVGVTAAQLIKLGQVKLNGGSLRLRGKVTVDAVSYEQAMQLIEIYGSNCFNAKSEFCIKAPSAVYLVGPKSIKSGTTGKYKVVVLGDTEGDMLVLSEEALPSFITLDNKTGKLSVGRTFSNSTLKMYARAKIDGVFRNSDVLNVSLQGLKDVSKVSLSGRTTISKTTTYTLVTSPIDIDCTITTTWSLSGKAVTNGTVSMGEQTNSACEIIVNKTPSADEIFYIAAKVVSESGISVDTDSVRVIVNSLVKPEPNGNIQMSIKPNSDNKVSLSIAASSPFTIIWGDGETDSITSDLSNKRYGNNYVHQYSSNKIVLIEIGNCEGVSGCYLTKDGTSFPSYSLGYMYAYWTIGNSQVYGLDFRASKNYLRFIGGDLFDNETDRTTNYPKSRDGSGRYFGHDEYDSSVFYGAANLQEIPANLFSKCPNIQYLNYTFNGCTSLKTIPENLFSNLPNIKYCRAMFAMSGITEIPDGFLAHIDNMDCSGIFYGCKNLTKAPKFIENAYKVGEYMTQPTSTNRDYLSWASLSGIKELPDNFRFRKLKDLVFVFDNIPNAVQNLTKLFEYVDLTSITDASRLFYRNSVITEIPKGFISQLINISNLRHAFVGCTEIKTIPEGLFDNCPKLQDVYGMFASCRNIKTVPTGLFDKLPNLSDARELYYYCYALRKAVFNNNMFLKGSTVFANNSKLMAITITETKAPTSNASKLFDSIPSKTKIYVNDDMVETYKTATNWTQYADRIYPMSEYPGDEYYENLEDE